MRRHLARTFTWPLLFVLEFAAASLASAQGHIIILPADNPGEGFYDPTPTAPIGGNNGTTLGAQRLNVFNRAAEIWEQALKPRVDVFVLASFDDDVEGDVLGTAGTTFLFSDFEGAELPGTWYPSALADHLAGQDLNPGEADIIAQFNSRSPFYLGLDDNEPTGTFDLLVVVLHQLAHGLGFSNFVDESTGALAGGTPDIYSQYTLDVTTGKTWNQMTDTERLASAVNVRHVTWSGVNVNAAAAEVLSPGEPYVAVKRAPGEPPDPASLRASGPNDVFPVGPALFGPPLTTHGTSGSTVLVDDGVGRRSDGCSPLVNGAAVAGNIALVDRGPCPFVVQVSHAQAAGAIAVLIADTDVAEPPQELPGNGPDITIPSARVSRAVGNSIKARLSRGATSKLALDKKILAGTDRVLGLMMLAALVPVDLYASISHFDAVASPNQLMEPVINSDVTSVVGLPDDLTLALMTDLGWFSDYDGVPDGVDRCIGSDLGPAVTIEACDPGVPNRLLADGCTIADQIGICAEEAKHHKKFESCVSKLTKMLEKNEVITHKQGDALEKCAKRSAIGKQ